jgi:predicted transcriptional regulator of viral defense system
MTKNILKNDSELIKTLLSQGKELFTSSDINKYFFNGTGSHFQIYRVVKRLEEKGLLKRIQRGKFILLNTSNGAQFNPFVLAMHLIKPAAVAYWSALHYYGLTEQIPQTVFVMSTARKRSIAQLKPDFRFITVNKKKFFGIKKEWIGHLSFYITELEKTIVDCFDCPQLCGGIVECSKALLNASNVNYDLLLNYLYLINNSAALKRIGFVSEIIHNKKILEKLNEKQNLISTKYSLLDPSLSNQGQYNSKWRLRINTSIRELI